MICAYVCACVYLYFCQYLRLMDWPVSTDNRFTVISNCFIIQNQCEQGVENYGNDVRPNGRLSGSRVESPGTGN